MKDEGFKQAVDLLERLGHHSWPSFVKTVYLESVTYSIVSLSLMVLLMMAGFFGFPKIKKDADEGAAWFAFGVCAVFCLTALFNGVGHLTDAMNPEGAAVVKFLKLLRGT